MMRLCIPLLLLFVVLNHHSVLSQTSSSKQTSKNSKKVEETSKKSDNIDEDFFDEIEEKPVTKKTTSKSTKKTPVEVDPFEEEETPKKSTTSKKTAPVSKSSEADPFEEEPKKETTPKKKVKKKKKKTPPKPIETSPTEVKSDKPDTDLDGLLDGYLDLKSVSNVDVSAASRTSSSSSKSAPATILTITSEEIEIRGYQSLIDVLMDLPDFQVQTNNDTESLHGIVTRGLKGQDKFVILLDGIRISSPTNEIMPILENYPVHIAKTIEVIYGPASALYGADAFAGIINITTKKGFDVQSKTQSTVQYGMFNKTNATFLYADNLGERINLTVGGQYMYDQQPDLSTYFPTDFAGISSLRTGTFRTANSAFGAPEVTPKTPVSPEYKIPILAYNAFANLQIEDFQFSFFHNYAQTPTATSYTPDNAVYNEDAFFGQSITAISGTYTKNFEKAVSISAFTLSRYDLNPNSNYRNVFVGLDPGYKYAFGAMMKAEQLFGYTVNDDLSLTSGVTYESFYSVPKGTDLEFPVDTKNAISGLIKGSVIPQFPSGYPAEFFQLAYSNLGGFLQAQYLPDPSLAFTIGTRVDHNSRFGTTINPRAGVVWRPSDKFTLKTLYGAAFLAPAPRYAFEYFGSVTYDSVAQRYRGGNWRLPNPNLGPMKNHTFELGISTYITPELSVSINGYYSLYSGLFNIVLDSGNTNLYYDTTARGYRFGALDINRVTVPQNAGTQTNYGASFIVQLLKTFGKLRVNTRLSLSYVDGTTDLDENPLTPQEQIGFLSPLMVKGLIDLTWGDFSLSTRAIYMGDQRGNQVTKADPTVRQTIPGYLLVNMFAKYAISEKVDFHITAQNLLDARYRVVNFDIQPENVGSPDAYIYEFPNGTPQNPLRILGGVSFSF